MNSPLPLSGIRVVDLTRVLSGPFCSMLLGDLGADIVKVETPGEGDTVRHQGAGKDGLSWYFANYNRLIFRWTPRVTADFLFVAKPTIPKNIPAGLLRFALD